MEDKRDNLIVRLYKKLKTLVNSKLVRSVASLAIAATMTATLMVGCAPTTDPGKTDTDNPKPGITTPTTKYSKILEEVLDSEYYSQLVEEIKPIEHTALSKYSKINCHVGHPFGFLEKKGYNINAIKNGSLECLSESYIMDGDYYIKTMVAVNDVKPYYDTYLLKYDLSKEEKDDLDMLFNGNYHEAPLFIQELTYKKTPTVVGQGKQEIEVYKKLLNSFRTRPNYSSYVVGTLNVNILLTDAYYLTEYGNRYQTYYVYTRNEGNNRFYTVSGKAAELKFKTPFGISDGGIVNGPSDSSELNYVDDFTPEVKNITWYNTQYVYSTHKSIIDINEDTLSL